MKAIIRDRADDILLSTVALGLSEQNPENVYLIRCYRCGSALSQVKGEVIGIFAGLVPTEHAVVIQQCFKCKQNYTFQASPGLKPSGTISLTLVAEPGVNTFHCLICRMQLVQYSDKEHVMLPEYKHIPLPTFFTCFNPTCGKKYLLKEIVTSDIIE